MQFDIRYVARLARLALTKDESKQFNAQLAKILEYVQMLQTLDTKDVPPTSHPVPITNVFREDEPRLSLPVEHILQNAPEARTGHFVVPKIIEPT